ncbi:hypothetical protein NX794_18025 [Streptomyces sp. LP11]|uniref:Uncharacterized protein n=1 Tax=Streptomyces pyxinicus TaxID=2970331 RepID=A0ABT2B3J9_9ACTN|nr:hypothetical protein [Streptomyces sp. LP11]MCS0603094.1 hypothetical protein [Streptomyces sp. LP11]
MAYELRAVIAAEAVLRPAAAEIEGARVARLAQGLALLPVTDEVLGAVTDGGDARRLGFRSLTEGWEGGLARWSVAGPVAYVEVEYFGGAGEERAAVWAGGALTAGPFDTSARRGFRREVSPVSAALRRLGVRAERGQDAFEAVGLERHRFTEDWAAEGARS